MPPAYHLWLEPSGPPRDLFSRTIRRLAREFHAPVFEPHVTLAGPLGGTETELFDRCDRLRRELAPFDIVLDAPMHGPEFFRCVFMRARPDTAILGAHDVARRVFELPDRPFMPHLSLLYGTYTDTERQHIVDTLPAELCLSFTAVTVDLILSRSDDPKDWHSVRSLSLDAART